MTHQRVILDTNIYVDWLRRRKYESWVTGPGVTRTMSAVVGMELLAGAVTLPARRAVDQALRAYRTADRILAPSPGQFERAGVVLRRLWESGRETRRASLVHDVLIALTARDLGATVVTCDGDFDVIGTLVDVEVERVTT